MTAQDYIDEADYLQAIRVAALRVRDAYEDDTSGGGVFFDAVEDMLALLDEGEAR